jgi:hypothetical protein
MSSSESRQRRIRVGLLALITAAITAVAAAPASAAPATGTAKIVLSGSQSDGKLGNRQASLSVADLELFAEGASATTRHTLKLRNGKRSARLRGFEIEAGGKATAISAKLGKARLTFFRASGNLTIAEGAATLRNAKLSLTGKGAARLREKLGLDGLKAGETGRFSLDASLESKPSTPTPAAPAEKPSCPSANTSRPSPAARRPRSPRPPWRPRPPRQCRSAPSSSQPAPARTSPTRATPAMTRR